MHWQATRNWDRLIGWGLLFLWVGNPLASAQTSEDILRLISQDEEDTVHEDELIILDDILSKSTGLTHQLLEEILALTFLANEYYDLIRNSLDSPDFTSLKTSQKISPALMFIFVTLQRNKRGSSQNSYSANCIHDRWSTISLERKDGYNDPGNGCTIRS